MHFMHCSDNENLKKKLIARLKRVEGQARALQKMVEEDRYCIDIITQSSAARSALASFEAELLEEHMKTCAENLIKSGKKEKLADEIIKIYKKATR